MTPDTSLAEWVKAQYRAIGFDSRCNFIGKWQFKHQLISLIKESEYRKALTGKSLQVCELEIRQLVNAEAYLTPSSTESSSASTVPACPPPGTTAAAPAEAHHNSIERRTTRVTRETYVASSHTYISSGINGESHLQSQSPTSEKPSSLINETNPVAHVKPQSHLNTKIQELRDDVEGGQLRHRSKKHEFDQLQLVPALESQLRLLRPFSLSDDPEEDLAKSDTRDAVLFSTDVLRRHGKGLLPQYGLLGAINSEEVMPKATLDRRLFLNTNIPFSAFICGLQGSGKSHTMSCFLENCLLQNPLLGPLQRPLSALVFHFGQYTSRLNFRACEAAFLAYPSPHFRDCQGVASVNVLVSPSNYHNLDASYRQIPGVRVVPLKLRSKDLNISSMLTLMSVDQTEAPPLYIGQITKILREMAAMSEGAFNYKAFKTAIEESQLTTAQRGPLQQRLDLLESFIDLDDTAEDITFEAGSITILDLSCPFIDSNTACVLFNIFMSMYLESDPMVGKIIAVDEAHKYMTNTPASKALTESLLTVIRQQRHFGARVIISTQEPTISPRLLDLCSISIIHRFSSPGWFEIICKHVLVKGDDKENAESLFNRIINLRVGEALVIAPSALLTAGKEVQSELVNLGSKLLNVKVRNRLTWDGGRSVVCLD